jgi:phenylalanyl-tRNA synthetase beta chain
MPISYQWLKELTGLDWPVQEVADRLTLAGISCESIEPTARYFDRVVVGEVTDLKPVKGADKIKLATVNVGDANHDLVCGAPNVAVGQKVPVALLGAKLAGDMEIKKVKIRGVESSGMICSERELGISDDHSGIMVLEPLAKPGTPLVEQLDYNDYILDFEITPNRGDALSAIGIARDLAALAGTKVNYPAHQLKTVSEKVTDVFQARSDDLEACARFTARIIRNVKIEPSPWWIQKKLITSGMRPVSNVVDITNLIMLETGNPIHAFDLDRFSSDQIVVRRAREGEMLTTLDGKEHKLSPDVLLITDGERARAAAGVMGGIDSEVEDTTKNILLEVAYFNPTVIRKSRKYLGIMSEASSRFERGVDPNNLDHASARASYLMQELCGGEVLDGLVDFYPEPIKPKAVVMRPDRCNAILGTTITVDRMKQILSGLEFEVSGDDPISATIPTFRHDIAEEIDLIEEVGRIEGYHSIPDATENVGRLFAPTNPDWDYENDLRRVLTAAGFDEILGHGLADSKLSTVLAAEVPQLKIVNPVSEDLDIMRNDLAHTALTAIGHNIAHRNLDLRLFEIGKAYFPADKKGEWIEEDRLLLAVTGDTPRSWRDKPRPMDFHDLAGALDQLARHFHWPDYRIEPQAHSYLEPGESFEITMGDHSVGWAGRVADKVSRRFEVKQPVNLVQLKLAPLKEVGRDQAEFQPLPVYPAATRDIAMVIDQSVRVGDLVESIRKSAGELAESVEVFDLYRGKQIGEGQQSVAVAISFRSPERSLSSEEVDKLQEDIVAELKRRFDVRIRDF